MCVKRHYIFLNKSVLHTLISHRPTPRSRTIICSSYKYLPRVGIDPTTCGDVAKWLMKITLFCRVHNIKVKAAKQTHL